MLSHDPRDKRHPRPVRTGHRSLGELQLPISGPIPSVIRCAHSTLVPVPCRSRCVRPSAVPPNFCVVTSRKPDAIRRPDDRALFAPCPRVHNGPPRVREYRPPLSSSGTQIRPGSRPPSDRRFLTLHTGKQPLRSRSRTHAQMRDAVEKKIRSPLLSVQYRPCGALRPHGRLGATSWASGASVLLQEVVPA